VEAIAFKCFTNTPVEPLLSTCFRETRADLAARHRNPKNLFHPRAKGGMLLCMHTVQSDLSWDLRSAHPMDILDLIARGCRKIVDELVGPAISSANSEKGIPLFTVPEREECSLRPTRWLRERLPLTHVQWALPVDFARPKRREPKPFCAVNSGLAATYE